MPFQRAESADLRLAGLSDSLRAALVDPDYSANSHQVYENVETDPLIADHPSQGGPASRQELLAYVEPHRIDPDQIKAKHIDFCRSHQQEGPPTPDAQSLTFGHVCRFEALIDGVRSADTSQTRKSVRAKLRNSIHDAPIVMRLSRQKKGMADKKLRRFQMWCYLPTNPRSPFAELGATRKEVVNVLGLGYEAFVVPHDELVRFAYRLGKGTQAYQPTAWDAECYCSHHTGITC